jgi:soluble lytic murein transglycosylase
MKIRPFKLIVTLMLIIAFAAAWQGIYKEGILKAVYPERYSGFVDKYAKESGIEPFLIYAVIKNESGFKPSAESKIGAKGLMQLTPETFDWAQMLVPTDEKYTSADLNKPEVNIKYGSIVLSTLKTEFGSTATALAAYHAGRSNVKKWLTEPKYSKDGKTLYYIPFSETRSYVKKVMSTEQTYKKLYDK